MSEERRQSLKLWKSRSFDVCKNAATPMIAILGHSELDMEISDAGMETTESDDCREMSKKDRDANGILAMMREEARFSYKDGQKFIDLIYLINQWIVSGKPVISKDQRAGKIKWSDIEVQIHTITSGENYKQVSNFRDSAV